MKDMPRSILALVPNWLGDVAMCTPALRALRKRFPDATLAVAGRKACCELLADLPWLDRRIELPPKPGVAALPGLARRLRPHARDLAVVFPHSFRTALLAFLAGAHKRVGYARDRRSLLLTDRVVPHRENGRIQPVYMAREYLDLVAPLGCEDDGEGLELGAGAARVQEVRRALGEARPVIGFAPGAAFGPSKRWPAERFAAVADALADRLGAQCVLLTGPGEEEIRDAVIGSARTTFVRWEEGGIPMLKAAISQLDLLIGNDSGTRHVAVAFKVPTVCVMGSTSPRYTEGPYERGRVVRVDVDCGPCQKPVCATDHRCMTQVTPEMVVGAALAVLGDAGPALNGTRDTGSTTGTAEE